jgi:histone-lysine N-methyltransferase SETD1
MQSTGMASKEERERVAALDKEKQTRGESSVTVRGSQIQGWGLYADHSFQKGEVVAEYVGEYVANPVTDRREKIYAEGRIQDYQFRVSANMVIDATKHGGFARYINHSCDPNCFAKIVDGEAPNQHLKRVIVSSQRSIEAGEEITYDYQFPIELDLDARLPCSCGSKCCRGFMNWDLPESSSLILRARTSRGRKERIRNLVRKDLNRKVSK